MYLFWNFSSQSSSEQCNFFWSSNGSLTFRVFEKWLFEFFEPYLAKTYPQEVGRDFALLTNAKLPLIDRETWRRIRGHNAEQNNRVSLHFFGIGREDMLPFNGLFKKTVRNRRVDVMLDSWRKTVHKTTGTSSKLRFESMANFMHLFEDAFQNCIEECVMETEEALLTDNDDVHNTSSACVQRLRDKICESFDTLKLWPIKFDDYQEYVNQSNKNLKSEDSLLMSKHSCENANMMMDVDDSDQEDAHNDTSNLINFILLPTIKLN